MQSFVELKVGVSNWRRFGIRSSKEGDWNASSIQWVMSDAATDQPLYSSTLGSLDAADDAENTNNQSLEARDDQVFDERVLENTVSLSTIACLVARAVALSNDYALVNQK